MPDFQRVLKALRGGILDRVPPCELAVDVEIKELYLGRRVTTQRDEVDFWLSAGYDFVVTTSNGQPISDEVSLTAMPQSFGEWRVHEQR